MSGSDAHLSFPRETLGAFGAASGDRSPLHCDDDYARNTAFGETIIHGSLSLLAMIARTPLGQDAAPLSVEAVFRQAVLPGRRYVVEAGVREHGWRAELLDEGVSVISSNLRSPVDPPEAHRPPGATPEPMRCEPATPSVSELMDGPSVFFEYRPDAERLLDLARSCSAGGDVSASIAVALGWISYVPGMELPGRDSMCRRVDLTVQGPLGGDGVLTSEARVQMFDERTDLLRVSGALFQGDRSVAECTLLVHWRRTPEGPV